MEWKPIETAPKTEDQILTFRHFSEETIIGGKEKDWFQTSFWSAKHKLYVGWPSNAQPTHWMPLPKAPNAPLEPRR
jgi:hypothetical protein